jgi:hypothetical protein
MGKNVQITLKKYALKMFTYLFVYGLFKNLISIFYSVAGVVIFAEHRSRTSRTPKIDVVRMDKEFRYMFPGKRFFIFDPSGTRRTD